MRSPDGAESRAPRCLSRFPPERRLFLDEAAARDRRASGHSIIGLAVFGRSALRAEAIGRCWPRGRVLSWLADS
ncbi:MAG: hypothetical protein AVDCRST_MAG77-2307 [uncultured Chloroflexi bacterium]|uniref:Uncharacterized protein n=1 Tax=uncultured Chloroflexota bacterium TaxID=166587 RepID=A0A6J4IP20_9CHLR|nr:MAG: hypothetical protein AVDCRST_MAG77-2307 [uncultured Chloroflexota bacterium]